MFNEKWLNLQLFAGDGTGDGGEGAATVDNANTGDDDRALRELGVPEYVLEKRAKRNAARGAKKAPEQKPAPEPEDVQQQTGEQAAAAQDPTEEKTETPRRMTWDEIMADPEYNKHMQATMQARLRSAKAAEEAMQQLTPALEVLARENGMDMENIDYAALADVINNNHSFYEGMALEKGDSIEKAMADDQKDRAEKREQRAQARTLEEQQFQNHILALESQAQEMKKVFPNFDLRKELQNPAFARMTAPGTGIMSVKDAYYAVHRNEIESAAMQVTAQTVAKKISNDIRSGSRRPSENGTTGQAPSVTSFNYRNATRDQREALKARIRSGEKIYPGQE